MTEKFSVEERFSNIEHNLTVIRENIELAARKSGRTSDDIKLMAVTKTVEPIFINHAIDCGIDLIGENKEIHATFLGHVEVIYQLKEKKDYIPGEYTVE